MTNSVRTERMATAPTYREAWKYGNRCWVPALSYTEPYWETEKNIRRKFRRPEGALWLMKGL